METSKTKSFDAVGVIKNQALLIVAIVVYIVFGLIQSTFLTSDQLITVLRQIAIIAIMAGGMTYAIIGGNFDLSVGSLLSFCCAVCTVTVNSYGPIVAILATVVVGCLSGVVSGYLCGYLHLNSMVTTLGMMNILQALTLMYTGGQSVTMTYSGWFSAVGSGMLFGVIPVQVIIMAVFCIIFAFILSKTVFGHYVKAVGTNAISCRYSGIRDKKIIMLTFVISGFSTAIAALIMAVRNAGAQPTMGLGYEFDVITAVILGGAAVDGGEGSVYKSFLGALIIGILKSGFTAIGLSTYFQYLAEGLIILVVVYMDLRAKKGGNLS